jgi:hypothetical protein
MMRASLNLKRVHLKRLLVCSVLGLAASLLVPTRAEAWDSMRCGTRLVDKGDPLYKVKALCGDPDHEEATVEYRTVRERIRGPCQTDGQGRRVCADVFQERTIEVPVNLLIYDFGRNQFVNHLRFEFSRLVDIQSGDYGVTDND